MAIDTGLPISNMPRVMPPVQSPQAANALQPLQKFDLLQMERLMSETNLQQVNQYITSQLDVAIRAQACIVPYWTNEEEVRRKAIKRTNETRTKPINAGIAGDEEIAVMEVGFTAGMLALFLDSPAGQREAIRRIRRFAHLLRDSKQQGGVYFLDETQAAVWTREEDAPPDDPDSVQVLWMHPQALTSLSQPQTVSTYTPPIRITKPPMPAKAANPLWQQTDTLQSTGAQTPGENMPRKGFFRAYED